jgi:hypothetical protein
MFTVISIAPTPIFVPILDRTLDPEVEYEISEAQASEIANHPWLKVTKTNPVFGTARAESPVESENE